MLVGRPSKERRVIGGRPWGEGLGVEDSWDPASREQADKRGREREREREGRARRGRRAQTSECKVRPGACAFSYSFPFNLTAFGGLWRCRVEQLRVCARVCVWACARGPVRLVPSQRYRRS